MSEEKKEQYFYRTSVFTRVDNQVGLVDIFHPEKITPLDNWLGLVISLADGLHTLSQLSDFIRVQYQQAPDNFQETLDSVVERLIDGSLIKLADKSVTLPYYLISPIEELDVDKAIKLIREDGYEFEETELSN